MPLDAACHYVVHTEGAAALEEVAGIVLEEVAAQLARELAAKPAHDCEDHAVLREDARTLASRYVCDRCGFVLPDEQEGATE